MTFPDTARARAWVPVLRDSAVLGSGTMLLYGAGWAYHMAMSRLLGPEEYGALNALVGLLLVMTVPAYALQMGWSVQVARLTAAGEGDAVRDRMIPVLRAVLVIAGALCVILAAGSGPLARALKLASPMPVVITGVVLVAWSALHVLRGTAQGMHRFTTLAASLASEGVLKLGIGVALVSLGLGLGGAVAGFGLGAAGAVLLTEAALRGGGRHGARPDDGSIPDLGRRLIPYAAVIGCFAILTQGDVVMVKALLDPHQAGIYAAASTGGKTILYVTSALPMIVLPETARRHRLGQDQRAALVRLMAIGASGGGVLVAAYFLFPARVVGLLFGARYLDAAPLLGWIGFGMLAFQLAMLAAYAQLASGSPQVARPLGALAALFPVVTWLVRGNPQAMAVLIAVMGHLAFLAVWSQAARGRRSAGPVPEPVAP